VAVEDTYAEDWWRLRIHMLRIVEVSILTYRR
jgi:hypothetical protein